jgi:stage II sporulation protein M
MKKKEGNYALAWKFLKDSKFYFLSILVLFFVSIAIGFIFPVFFQDFIKRFVEETLKKTEGLGFFQLFVFILLNNLTTAFIGIIFGLVLGVFPVVLTLLNGYVLGFIANKAVGVAGASVLLRLLPHGVFEIPALIIALGLGLRAGTFIFRKNRTRETFFSEFENSLRVFLFVVLPLLFIAALIETSLILLLK